MNNFCTQCGTNNNGGNFCVKCGASMNIQANYAQQSVVPQSYANTGRLVIQRRGKIMGAAIKINVKVNGVAYELGAGENIVLDLVPGIYQITYDVWCRREKAVTINIVSGNNYLIDFVYDPLWGGFKIGKESKLQ